MRQAGIIAASGDIALNQSIKQLAIVHENVKYLADEINKPLTVNTARICRDAFIALIVFG